MPTAIQRARRALAEDRDRGQHDEHRRDEADRGVLGERQEAQAAEEEARRRDEAQGAQDLHLQMLRAPEVRPRAMARERRDDRHLPRVARPHDQEQRVVAHDVLRGGVEQREEHAGEHEHRQGGAQRMGGVVRRHGRT
ncbi:MAG: hypothetical protein U1F48_06335 [Burkholderiales bacterium]